MRPGRIAPGPGRWSVTIPKAYVIANGSNRVLTSILRPLARSRLRAAVKCCLVRSGRRTRSGSSLSSASEGVAIGATVEEGVSLGLGDEAAELEDGA